jgi:hypothetical protein
VRSRGERWRSLARRLTTTSTSGEPPAPASGSPARDVFLLGSSYSGSTHLGGLLEANLDAIYVGEVAHLPSFVDRFHLFDVPIGCLRCSGQGVPCPRWTPEILAEVARAAPGGTAGVLRSASGSTLVVDGSKWPEWLRQSVQDRPPDAPPPVAVVAARSPFSYALSARGASGEPTWVVAAWWRDVYIDALRTLNLFGVPYVVVRNEDVRTDPARAISRVARLTGQPEPTGPVRPARPTHSIGGNVYVQHGYRESSTALLEKIGLGSADAAATWQGPRGRAMAEQATTTAALLPSSRSEALSFASDLMQCPSLVETAQLLGYSMSAEVERFVDACREQPSAEQPGGEQFLTGARAG